MDVQKEAIAHPTDDRLIHRAIETLVDLAKREGIGLRQGLLFERIGIKFGFTLPKYKSTQFNDRRASA